MNYTFPLSCLSLCHYITSEGNKYWIPSTRNHLWGAKEQGMRNCDLVFRFSFVGECPSAPKADFRLERLSFLLKRLNSCTAVRDVGLYSCLSTRRKRTCVLLFLTTDMLRLNNESQRHHIRSLTEKFSEPANTGLVMIPLISLHFIFWDRKGGNY